MRKKGTYRVWLAASLIVIWGAACSLLGGGEEKAPGVSPAEAPAQEQAAPTSAISAKQGGEGGEQVLDTEFPLPKDVQGFMHLGAGEDAVNFQTKMSIDETVAFYRDAFGKQGLTEYDLLTSIQDNAFSMVFKGSANGKDLVIQGVDLGNGTTNINIRYEDV